MDITSVIDELYGETKGIGLTRDLVSNLSQDNCLENEELGANKLIQLLKQHTPLGALTSGSTAGITPLDIGLMIFSMAKICPALAVMSTMHHHSVLAISKIESGLTAKDKILNDVLTNQKIIASAFAEGISGRSVLVARVNLEKRDEQFFINGIKRPCTIAEQADYIAIGMTMSIDDEDIPVIATIRPDRETAKIEECWENHILKSAGHYSIEFNDALVSPSSLVLDLSDIDAHTKNIQTIQAIGILWFHIFASFAYAGVVAGLTERVYAIKNSKYFLKQNILLSTLDILDRLITFTREAQQSNATDPMLVRSIALKNSVAIQVENSAKLVSDYIGGIGFMKSPDIYYLMNCASCLKYHPLNFADSGNIIREVLDI